MANDKQYDLDELNQKLEKMNDLLKSGEKRFEELLKVVNNLQKTGSKAPMYGSNATSELAKRYEKKVQEEMKLMDKAYQIKSLLIDQEYDRVEQNRKEAQENTRQFILKRRETAELIENAKTKRKEMSLQAKRIEMMGRMASGAGGGLAGFIGMGIGSGAARLAEGGGAVAKRSEGLQERILNYQKMAGTQEKSSIGTPTGKIQSNMLARLEKISPKLASFAYGKEGENGREGGALGKGAGAIGKMGGMLGMAGGIGGGLLGGAIMKGLESSPMFQAISKIMGTAFNLILRPIGDFFSAVFKPISIVLMKWGAVNLRNWAKSMQEGTNEAMNAASMIGKSIVAFFNDPLGLITAAIKSGMGFLDFNEYVTNAVNNIDATLTEQLGGIPGAMMAAGAGVISGIETKVKEASPDMKPVNDKLDVLVDNTKPKTTPFGGYGSAEEQQSELNRLMAESQKEFSKYWEGTWLDPNKQKGGTSDTDAGVASNYEKAMEVSGGLYSTLQEGGKEIYDKYVAYKLQEEERIKAAEEGSDANSKVIETYMTLAKMNQDTNISISEMTKHSEQIQRIAYAEMNSDTKKSEGYVKEMAYETEEMMNTIKEAFDRAKATLDAMKSSSKKSKSGKAGGGLINERIFGVGERTGNEYVFGEAGREFVVPESKSGGLGNVTINVNVAKMSSDVDLQKLKPIIERAILETHARRGLI